MRSSLLDRKLLGLLALSVGLTCALISIPSSSRAVDEEACYNLDDKKFEDERRFGRLILFRDSIDGAPPPSIEKFADVLTPIVKRDTESATRVRESVLTATIRAFGAVQANSYDYQLLLRRRQRNDRELIRYAGLRSKIIDRVRRGIYGLVPAAKTLRTVQDDQMFAAKLLPLLYQRLGAIKERLRISSQNPDDYRNTQHLSSIVRRLQKLEKSLLTSGLQPLYTSRDISTINRYLAFRRLVSAQDLQINSIAGGLSVGRYKEVVQRFAYGPDLAPGGATSDEGVAGRIAAYQKKMEQLGC